MQFLAIDESFADWEALLALILDAFAYMHPRIDPPSSALRLTLGFLKEKARTEKGYAAIEDGHLLGCIFCKPESPDCLYIGKLAVTPQAQGKGVGRFLLEIATDYAVRQQLPCLRLETRIELTENHGVFARWGFVRSADGVHPGFSRTTFIEMRKPI
ncbi:GNAT family N-acetyltransferase [Pararhizobium sp. O133]|uniref:GNAT family N-acetyltransferase n=1 Tax=Pararhizobium sp. O133 TaxID=3449278 RepID=UPI003F685CB8